MGSEVIIYGCIVGTSWRAGEKFTWTHDLNYEVLESFQGDDNWPWLIRDSIALPAPYPKGTYRSQVIHFGLSAKDEPSDDNIWSAWLSKFELILKKLYWSEAVVHLKREFGPTRVFKWFPTESSLDQLYEDPPQPVREWVRSDQASESD